ncbi:MAG: hypothetical protein ACFCUM_02775 [Bacteroidales bacterium]
MKIYFKAIALAMAVSLMANVACKKEERCSVHPEPFRFSIIDNQAGTDLLKNGTFDAEKIGIHYFYNNERHDLIINNEIEPLSQYTELKVIQLPMISLTGRTNIFYLELNTELTDTLEIVVEKEAMPDCDYHPYTMAKHNGTNLTTGTGGVYLIRK